MYEQVIRFFFWECWQEIYIQQVGRELGIVGGFSIMWFQWVLRLRLFGRFIFAWRFFVIFSRQGFLGSRVIFYYFSGQVFKVVQVRVKVLRFYLGFSVRKFLQRLVYYFILYVFIFVLYYSIYFCVCCILCMCFILYIRVCWIYYLYIYMSFCYVNCFLVF